MSLHWIKTFLEHTITGFYCLYFVFHCECSKISSNKKKCMYSLVGIQCKPQKGDQEDLLSHEGVYSDDNELTLHYPGYYTATCHMTGRNNDLKYF